VGLEPLPGDAVLASRHLLLRRNPPFIVPRDFLLKQSQHFLENAENCAQMAERAQDEPTRNRYKRMEASWRALAAEQDWLDGQVPPVRIATAEDAQRRPRRGNGH
jgi:ATP/maltotriose-dependent transcriptional regulator MalT